MDRGMIERALNEYAPVCGTPIASAYDKPRSLWVMHHAVRDKAVVALGEQETRSPWTRSSSGCAPAAVTGWAARAPE